MSRYTHSRCGDRMGKEKEPSACFPTKIHARVWLGELVDTDGAEGSTHLAMIHNPCLLLLGQLEREGVNG